MGDKYSVEDAPPQAVYSIEDAEPPVKKGFWDSYDKAVAPYVTPTPHNLKSLLPVNGQFDPKAYLHEGETALSNIGAGGLGVILHPVNTVGGILKSAAESLPPVALAEHLMGKKTSAEEMGEQLRQAPLETAETMAGQTAAMGAGAKALTSLPQVPGKVMRAVTKTSPAEMTGLVSDTQAANALGDAYSKARAAVETARQNALKIGNSKYNTVNNALNMYEADPKTTISILDKTAESLPGTDAPPLVRSFDERINGRGKDGMARGAMTYDELQSYYSKLGNALSKGTLDGETYHAYDVMHDAVGDEMQRIANEHDYGPQLTEARNYWRRMKQTFGKPLSQTDAATSTLRTFAPEATEADTVGNRVRMMGSFDPEIPKAFDDLRKAHEAAKEAKVEPTTPGETKKLDNSDLQQQKLKSLTEGTERVRKVGRKIVNYGIGLKALWDAYHLNVGSAASDVALGYGGYKAADAFANFLERPRVKDMLTKVTDADIAQIPPELRGPNLKPMLDEAKAKGVKVDPKLYALAGMTQPKKRVAAALSK